MNKQPFSPIQNMSESFIKTLAVSNAQNNGQEASSQQHFNHEAESIACNKKKQVRFAPVMDVFPISPLEMRKMRVLEEEKQLLSTNVCHSQDTCTTKTSEKETIIITSENDDETAWVMSLAHMFTSKEELLDRIEYECGYTFGTDVTEWLLHLFQAHSSFQTKDMPTFNPISTWEWHDNHVVNVTHQVIFRPNHTIYELLRLARFLYQNNEPLLYQTMQYVAHQKIPNAMDRARRILDQTLHTWSATLPDDKSSTNPLLKDDTMTFVLRVLLDTLDKTNQQNTNQNINQNAISHVFFSKKNDMLDALKKCTETVENTTRSDNTHDTYSSNGLSMQQETICSNNESCTDKLHAKDGSRISSQQILSKKKHIVCHANNTMISMEKSTSISRFGQRLLHTHYRDLVHFLKQHFKQDIVDTITDALVKRHVIQTCNIMIQDWDNELNHVNQEFLHVLESHVQDTDAKEQIMNGFNQVVETLLKHQYKARMIEYILQQAMQD